MQNNNGKINSQELLSKYAVFVAAETEGEELLKENEKLKLNPTYCPTEKDITYLKNMLRKGGKHQLRKKGITMSVRICVAVVLLVSSCLIVVPALREPILNFFSFDKNFDVYIDQNGNSVELHDLYVPSYYPNGYKIVSHENGEHTKIIKYLSDLGDGIWFTQYVNAGLNVDNEGAIIEKISEKGFEATIIRKNGVKILWNINDKIMLLYTQSSELEPELIKMAKSVTFIE